MSDHATIEIRLAAGLNARLEALARVLKRSESEIVTDANEAYVDFNERQITRIKEALEEARSGAPGVPHEEVVKWLQSLGTENELPRPRPPRS
jgi:predicted transcriptional regulator